uniref:Uncharacterized protein n=1 Tax=Globisporangium ultimum (strain ATCC 200006 / CBS 805.95 / DAOM BR144) TaxID=431595 RepID=K3WP25_GLOUD
MAAIASFARDSSAALLPPLTSAVVVCQYGNLAQLRALPHVVQRINKYYKAFQFSNGLVFAVQHDNLEMVEWLCQEYCPAMGFSTEAMEEAEKLGRLRIVQ